MKRRILYLLILMASVFIVAIYDHPVFAMEHKLKSDEDNYNIRNAFQDSGDDVSATISSLEKSGTKNMLCVIDYHGPGKSLDCKCDNTLYIEANKTWYYWSRYYESYYTSEHFDWNESRRFFFYLPGYTQNVSGTNCTSGYQIRLMREHSSSHNKGGYDNSANYNPNKSHVDECFFNAYYYDVEKIGVETDTLSVGEKTKAYFVCGDFDYNVTWSTDNVKVLAVDANGDIQAKKGETANILLNIGDQTVFKQKVSVEDIETPDDMRLYSNDRSKISVSGAKDDIVWKSENEDIAVVYKDEVIAKNIGYTNIVGAINGVEISFRVTVNPRSLTENFVLLFPGEKKKISVLGGTETQTEWTSEDDSVVKVNNGTITALKPGNTVITAKMSYQTLECNVLVMESSLSTDNLDIELGDKIELKVNGSSATPEYSSSDENVVAVKKGELQVKNSGKATISVKVGSETLKCKVNVRKKAAPTGIRTEASSSIIKLDWDDYADAKSFSVYLYNSDKKELQLIGSPKKSAYTVKDLEPGKTYIFRIAANVKINGTLIEQSLSDKIKCKTDKKDKVGWQTIDGKKYYYKDGFVIEGGLQKIDGSKYIFNSDGSVITDRFITIDGSKYYSDSTGKIVVNKEVTDAENNVTYEADSNGILTKKKKASSTTKTSTSTKTITFNDVTIDIPTSWGSQYKDSDAINYYFGKSTVMIYTDPKSGSLTQSKADWLVDEFDEYCCTSLEVTKSKKYTYDNKKISAYYIYNLDLRIPNSSYTSSTPFKGRLTAFEYNGKYYVAVIMVEKNSYNESSFDEYTEMIKSIKPVTKSTGGTVKKDTGGSKNGGTKTTGTTVYITKTGKSYHYINPCGNGTYYAVDLSWAKANGYSPCGKCAK